MKEITLTEEDKKKIGLPIHRGDKVKIIRERETDGLLGAWLPVIDVNDEFVDVVALGHVVRFLKQDVVLYQALSESINL